MNKLEVFFDYVCPFCLEGHENLMDVIGSYPQVEVVWCPCEAHPRPETYGPHSDLCIQGLYYAMDTGADLALYHERMYKGCINDKIDIENTDIVVDWVSDIVDAAGLKEALVSGRYSEKLLQANDYAYEQSGVWAVPSYRMNGEKLDAVEEVGVTKEQLKAFLDKTVR